MLFILIQFANPGIQTEGITLGLRSWIFANLALYVISSLLTDNPKVLKRGLIIFGIFTTTAFIKLLFQKYWCFDTAETEWLMQGSWRTHILNTGIRYFSIFTDAGNFGAYMGIVTITYSIIGLHTHKKWLSFFLFRCCFHGIDRSVDVWYAWCHYRSSWWAYPVLSHLQEYKSDVNFHADRFAVILFSLHLQI